MTKKMAKKVRSQIIGCFTFGRFRLHLVQECMHLAMARYNLRNFRQMYSLGHF
jgi:hypothetical protein